MDYKIPIPQLSASAFWMHEDKSPQNPGLIFDRFAPDWTEDPTLKRNGLEAARNAAAAKKADHELLSAWNRRWEIFVRISEAEPFSMQTDWRFVAGLGRKGPLEVGFTFHRYGFPILPGSSVKGIARAYAYLFERKDESNPEFKRIFGCAPRGAEHTEEAQCGEAIFFDAIPASLPGLNMLDMDIMNPHFPDYYQDKSGKTPPTDSQSPRPVYFLTVAPGTEFRFAVGWRGTLDEEARSLQKLAQDWLIRGLEELGAGAKTSAGYGYFLTTAVPEEITRAAEIPPERTAPAEAPESDLVRRIRSIPHSQVKGSIGNLADQWRRLPDGAEKYLSESFWTAEE